MTTTSKTAAQATADLKRSTKAALAAAGLKVTSVGASAKLLQVRFATHADAVAALAVIPGFQLVSDHPLEDGIYATR